MKIVNRILVICFMTISFASIGQVTNLIGVTDVQGDSIIIPVDIISKIVTYRGQTAIKSKDVNYNFTINESFNDLLGNNCEHLVEVNPYWGASFLIPKVSINRIIKNNIGGVDIFVGSSNQRIVTTQSMSVFFEELTGCSSGGGGTSDRYVSSAVLVGDEYTINITDALTNTVVNSIVTNFATLSDDDNQNLTLIGNDLSISGGNTVVLPVESQTLSIDADTLSILGGNSVVLPQGLLDTASSYSELRATSGGLYEEKIVVKDFTYLFDSKSYTTIGGVFYKVASGTENGGTIIVASDGTVWRRVWDGINIDYKWWECGGYYYTGVLNSDPLLSDECVANDNERIICAIETGLGKVINFEKDKIYEIDRQVPLVNNITLNGNGCTFKRPVATATYTYTATGTTSVTVSDASFFRAGQRLTFASDNMTRVSGSQIVSITGTTLTMTTAVPAGSGNVYLAIYMVIDKRTFGGVANTNSGNEIKYITFDGSRNNTFDYIGWDDNWTVSASYNLDSDPVGLDVHHCNFINIPQENIYCGSGSIHDNYYEGGNGSFLHLNGSSTGETSSDARKKFSVNVYNNIIKDVCEIANGHNEGVITFSALVGGIRIFNNKIANSGTGILGNYTSDDSNLLFQNNICLNAKTQILYSLANGYSQTTIKIIGNEFYSCGDIELNASEVATRTRDFILKDNRIYNGRIRLHRVDNAYIEGNTIAWVSGLEGFTGFGTATYGRESINGNADDNKGWIDIRYSTNIHIKNNVIAGDYAVLHDDQYVHGILYFRPSTEGATDGILDDKVFVCEDNHIMNVKRGITLNAEHTLNLAATRQAAFWSIKRNKVVMFQNITTTNNWGIQSFPGTEVMNNSVWMPNETSATTTIGISCTGIHTALEAVDKIGSVVMYNVVYNGLSAVGSNFSITVGNGVNNTYNNWVQYNTFSIPMNDYSGGNSFVANNTEINTNLTTFTGATAPEFKFIQLAEQF